MPRDKRLYMTFPNDFWQHPKIATISDAAFRTFVEMNGYSRMQNLDGRIPIATASKMWKIRPIRELLMSHPTRPLVLVDESTYVIRDYAEHQLTSEQIAKAQEASRTNGRLGGRPKNLDITQGVSVSEPRGNPAKSRDRDRDRSKATPSNEGVAATPKSPWCSRHPGGTEEACGPCRTARITFEAAQTAATTKPLSNGHQTPAYPTPDDGHRHKPDVHGYCIRCGKELT